MEEDDKLPLKRVELSLTKFNEVAIPHHLDLLRQHKANILKYEEAGEFLRVRAEQTHARRVAAQLRALLGELEALRGRVRAMDVPRFDRLTERSRDLTRGAIVDYLGAIESSCAALCRDAVARSHAESSPMSIARSPRSAEREGGEGGEGGASTESVGLVQHCAEPGAAREQVQLQLDEQELQLHAREAALRGWGELQGEVRALHEAWQHMQAAALASREQVSVVERGVHAAADNVQAARGSLASAHRLRAGAWGLCGLCAGALVGGPAGLLLGAKAGLALGLAAGGLGCLGGAALAAAPAPLPPAPGKKER